MLKKIDLDTKLYQKPITDKVKKTLDLDLKLYQKSIVERITKIDWKKGSESPLVVELDPTTACDLACPGCISEELLNQKAFSNERLLKIGEELIEAGIKAVVLIGGGEPLAHSAIGKLIELLGKNDVRIGITTNGTLINRHIDAIAEYSSWTRVSIDAGTKETFKYLRPDRNGNSKFDKVISNMKLLAKVKRGRLGYSFLIRTASDDKNIYKTNIYEIYEAAKLAREIGCDYFEVKPSYDMDHYLVIHENALMKKAQEEINRLAELETENFKILKSINLDFILKNEQNLQPKEYNSCPVSQLRTLVTPSGVYVCPYFRGRKDKQVGDVQNTSFHDMWHSQQRKEVMAELNPQSDCQMHCIRHSSNQTLFNLQEAESINTIEDFDFFI
jgi:MoaA/NifB/PqqE/SkfB family radical SAM enzyme